MTGAEELQAPASKSCHIPSQALAGASWGPNLLWESSPSLQQALLPVSQQCVFACCSLRAAVHMLCPQRSRSYFKARLCSLQMASARQGPVLAQNTAHQLQSSYHRVTTANSWCPGANQHRFMPSEPPLLCLC